MKRRLVTSNAAQHVELPQSTRSQERIWTASEVARFLAHVETHRPAAMYRLVVFAGLRRDEVVGLRWQDVNLDEGWLRISRGSSPDEGGRTMRTAGQPDAPRGT